MEQNNNPLIEKLLEFGKSKSIITWENVTDILGQDFIHTPEMENVLRLLEENKIQLIETDVIGIDEPTDDGDEDDIMLDQDDDDLVQDDTVSEIEKAEKAATKNKLVNNDKESNIDDPIRLYLRDIGKENLLTAEQEVELSKQMEDGNNIIKDVIKHSGIMIPEFFAIAQKAFTKIDDVGKTRKEINEEVQDKKRLKTFYSEYIKPVLPEIKQYISLKKQLFEVEQSCKIFENPQLVALREKILPELQKTDIQSEELEKFTQKYSCLLYTSPSPRDS